MNGLRYNSATVCWPPLLSAAGVLVAVSAALLTTEALGQPEWSNVAPASACPSPRDQHAMAYDGALGVTVLFGGSEGAGIFNGETWEWDGAAWSLIDMMGGPSPGPRAGHAMAYDDFRGVTVLFGGYDGAGPLGDTWEWDGTVWTEMVTAGPDPSPRNAHAMVYDPVSGDTLLFGGSDGVTSFGDTWTWDGSIWMDVATSGPSPRAGHAMVSDGVSATILFGGSEGGGIFNGETWEWDGVAWAEVPTAGPSPRSGHAMAYDSFLGVTVLFGGLDGIGSFNGQTWEWDGATWTLVALPIFGPGLRELHAMAYDSARGVCVMFGGYDGAKQLGDTWEWDGATWTHIIPPAPCPRWAHAMAYDAANGVTVLFGGNDPATFFDDTWTWDGTTWAMITAPGPSARSFHAMAYDSVGGVTVLFGGFGGAGVMGDTWVFDGTIGAWAEVFPLPPVPDPRSNHAMVYDAANGVTVLFGGLDLFGASLGDTWVWDGAAWAEALPGLSPGPREDHAMAYDPTSGLTMLFGGFGGAPLGDTWLWDGVTLDWTDVTTPGPAPRSEHAMAGDGAGGVVLFGGFDFPALFGDTWTWSGAGWTEVVTPGPSARRFHAMAYDSARDVTVLFGGGTAGGIDGETWELGSGGCSALDARSLKDHGAGDMPLTMGTTGGVEPRFGGIDKMEIDLDNASGFGSGVTVDCAPTVYAGTATHTGTVGNTVTITFVPGLPDETACTITLDCGAQICVRNLEGDSNRDGSTNPVDNNQRLLRFGQTAAAAGAEWDVNADGSVNPVDNNQTLLRFGNSPPVCP